MQQLPNYVYFTFGSTALLALFLFWKAAHFSKTVLAVLVGWIIIQTFLAINGMYKQQELMTARFPILVLPPVIMIIFLFSLPRGRAFIDSLDIRTLTIFHIIRIPVELTLLWLFMNHAVPRAMTFEGRNFDIFSGLSAPIVYYFMFVKQQMNKTIFIIWNIVCILLLLNVVSTAVLSLPGRFTNFGFEQPNIAIGYFPFVLLPSLLVPLALFCNLAAIRR